MAPGVPLLFDLDETLVVDERAAAGAFEVTARLAASRRPLDERALAASARTRARELWHTGPDHDYCRRIGISSWEGLWCRFDGDATETCALRAWSPAYRREAWRLALAEHGVDDAGLAEELGERFAVERRARHETYADAEPVLRALARSHPLALVTNGAACLQREKLEASGLGRLFGAVVVSADIGVGKPDPSVFHRTLELLGAGRDGARAVIVGDSLTRDVAGAAAAGLSAVWLDREGRGAGADGVPSLASLHGLPALLERLG